MRKGSSLDHMKINNYHYFVESPINVGTEKILYYYCIQRNENHDNYKPFPNIDPTNHHLKTKTQLR